MNVLRKFARLGPFLTTAAWYGCVAHCVFEHCGDFVLCYGPSMEPTIHSKDVVVTEHFTPAWRRPRNGDIVVVRAPHNPHQFICKRVVAVPGDRIPGQLKFVPQGRVWLEGDNPDNSTDSRNYGPVPMGLIRGRAIATVWPPSAAQSLVPDLYADSPRRRETWKRDVPTR